MELCVCHALIVNCRVIDFNRIQIFERGHKKMTNINKFNKKIMGCAYEKSQISTSPKRIYHTTIINRACYGKNSADVSKRAKISPTSQSENALNCPSI